MDDQFSNAAMIPRRKAWVAAILALLWGPLALVYCGRFKRAAAWVAANVLFAVAGAACLLYLPAGKIGVIVGIALIVLPQLSLVVDAIVVARRTGAAVRQPYQRVWIYFVLAAATWLWSTSLQIGFRDYWAEAFYMPTRSMLDTILPGDRFLVDKLVLRFRAPKHGDVVAHRSPEGVVYCRRIIGLPGDVIEIRDEKVVLNGSELREPHAKLEGPVPPYERMVNFGPITVAQGEVFLLGDHRRMSNDSRFEGPYRLDAVVGVARVVFWSREYTETPPQRPSPEPTVEWGAVRWDRIGVRLDAET